MAKALYFRSIAAAVGHAGVEEWHRKKAFTARRRTACCTLYRSSLDRANDASNRFVNWRKTPSDGLASWRIALVRAGLLPLVRCPATVSGVRDYSSNH